MYIIIGLVLNSFAETPDWPTGKVQGGWWCRLLVYGIGVSGTLDVEKLQLGSTGMQLGFIFWDDEKMANFRTNWRTHGIIYKNYHGTVWTFCETWRWWKWWWDAISANALETFQHKKHRSWTFRCVEPARFAMSWCAGLKVLWCGDSASKISPFWYGDNDVSLMALGVMLV